MLVEKVCSNSNRLALLGESRQRAVGWWAGARRKVGRALLERSHVVLGGHCESGFWMLWVGVVGARLLCVAGDKVSLEVAALWWWCFW